VTNEEAIRALIDARVAALEAGDGAAAVADLAPDIVAFEVAGPLITPSDLVLDVVAAEAWLQSFDGPIRVEIADLAIHVGGDVAFAHSLNRLVGSQGGQPIDFWMRSTLGFRRIDGEWKVVHAHTSIPRG
jgi:ketosteroid isomerase-like protein